MRIFLPLTAERRTDLDAAARSSRPRIPLDARTHAWAVSPWARQERPDEDPEDLEYDALQDAVHVALEGGDATGAARGTGPGATGTRAAVIAGDVPDATVGDASADGGAFGIVLTGAATLEIASLHVTELAGPAARASDTDPALLWFDASEIPAALDYSASRPT